MKLLDPSRLDSLARDLEATARELRVVARATRKSLPTSDTLTARQLVAALNALEACSVTTDAVRKWIQRATPCPIAFVGLNGQAHRYRLLDVIDWLLAEARRERAKPHVRAGGEDPVAALERARSRAAAALPPVFD